MPSSKLYCYACEREYAIISGGIEHPSFCPYCSASLEDADKDEYDPSVGWSDE